MPVGSGRFQLYSHIKPQLTAGDYVFRAQQHLNATGHPQTELGVDPLETHVRVRSPQYVLPPDQVLSTFPPAGREGSFGARLPQIVLRRRTLPWERTVDPDQIDLPWLALVLIAEDEDEAQLVTNQPVAQCVTKGVNLDEPADVPVGNHLEIRRSMVHKIFPTQQEVGLLAHAREVDINDTELMMGDDDGCLAVVVGNRLPLPGRDADGNEVPRKYLACLVNLCGQFDRLLDQAPEPVEHFHVPTVMVDEKLVTLAEKDHLLMGTNAGHLWAGEPEPEAPVAHIVTSVKAYVETGAAAPYEAAAGWISTASSKSFQDVYAKYADGFTINDRGAVVLAEPVLRFPVLIHWSFTSVGDETFRSLMEGLSSGMLGGAAVEEGDGGKPKPTTGRLPVEVVETGHVGLPHRTRLGDQVRSWYRGPLLPHPPAVDDPRLPLAHAADQIRVVVPDGREDLSLAAAFEVGRLLGLSRTSMVAALMRWRQLGYQAARRAAVLESSILAALAGRLDLRFEQHAGGKLGALVAERIVKQPEVVLGNPDALVTPGRPVLDEPRVSTVLANGLGLNPKVFDGDRAEVLAKVLDANVRLPEQDLLADPGLTREVLGKRLDTGFARAAVQALVPSLGEEIFDRDGLTGVPLDLKPDVLAGGAVAGGLDPAVLDRLRLDETVLDRVDRPDRVRLAEDALDRLLDDRLLEDRVANRLIDRLDDPRGPR